MTTDQDLDTRTVLSWLRADTHENVEGVLQRALDEVDMTPQRRSWRPALRTNGLSSQGRLVAAAAAVLLVAIGGFQALGGSIVSPSPTPTPGTADSRSLFIGVWISTSDADGGTQTMTIERAADSGVTIVVTDTIATVCAGTSSTMTGTGSVDGGTLVIPAPAYRCDDGTTPQTVSGPPLDQQLRNLTYRYASATDTLSVGIDDLWRREGARQPSSDPSLAPTPSLTRFPTSAPTTPPLAAPPFGPAGNGIIAFEKDGDILAADLPGGEARPLVVGPERDFEPTFSPDGTRLAFQRQTGLDEAVLMVADADGRNVVQVTPEPLFLGAWSFAPDGRSIVGVEAIDGEKRVIVRPLDPAASATLLDIRMPGGWMYIVPPSFRPSNPQEILVVAQLAPEGPRGLYVYDLTTNGIRTIVEEADSTEWLWDVAWSPNGEHITYTLGDGPRVVAADGSGDHARVDAWTTTFDDQMSAWSNDGTRVVVTRDTGGVVDGQQAVVSIDGVGEPIVLACGPTTDTECPSSWSWSPDDSMLIGTTYREASPGVTYQLADPATGQVTELDRVGDGTPTWQRVAP